MILISTSTQSLSFRFRLSLALLGASTVLAQSRSEEHTSELQSLTNLVCRLLLEKKKNIFISEGRSIGPDYNTRRILRTHFSLYEATSISRFIMSLGCYYSSAVSELTTVYSSDE